MGFSRYFGCSTSNRARVSDAEAVWGICKRYYFSGPYSVEIKEDENTGQCFISLDTDGEFYVAVDAECGECVGAVLYADVGVDFDDDHEMTDQELDMLDEAVSNGGEAGFLKLLLELAPYLETPFTVHTVGGDIFWFPLYAQEWHIRPGATEVEINGFQHRGDDNDATAEQKDE